MPHIVLTCILCCFLFSLSSFRLRFFFPHLDPRIPFSYVLVVCGVPVQAENKKDRRKVKKVTPEDRDYADGALQDHDPSGHVDEERIFRLVQAPPRSTRLKICKRVFKK